MTSAIGRKNSAGFSLVELLVVLVLLGLFAGLVAFNLPSDNGALRRDAARLAQAARLAAEEAILTSRPHGLVLSDEGWWLVRLERGQWLDVDLKGGQGRWKVAESVALRNELGLPIALDPDRPAIRYDGLGQGEPFSAILGGTGDRITVFDEGFGQARIGME